LVWSVTALIHCIGAPALDVHLFVVQLAHSVFVTLITHSYTSAHGVDLVVRAPDGDLGAVTRFPRDAAYFDCAIGNFAHFQFKKTTHKIGVTARDDDLRAANAVFDRDYVGAEPVTEVVVFNGHPFALGHDRLKLCTSESQIRPHG